MKKPKNKQNQFIKYFNKFTTKFKKSLQKRNYSKEAINNWYKNYTERMYLNIIDNRQDKTKTAKEQVNEEQLEFIKYLEKELGYEI